MIWCFSRGFGGCFIGHETHEKTRKVLNSFNNALSYTFSKKPCPNTLYTSNTHLLISKTKSFSIIFSLPVCYFFLSCFFVFFRGFRGYFFFTLLLSCFFVVFVAIFFSTLLFSCFFVGFVAISFFTLLFSCPFVGLVAIPSV